MWQQESYVIQEIEAPKTKKAIIHILQIVLTCSLKNSAANVTCTHMTTCTKIHEHLHAYIQIHYAPLT